MPRLTKHESVWTVALGWCLWICTATSMPANAEAPGKSVPRDFLSHTTIAGQNLAITTEAKAIVVCFIGAECPLVKLYLSRLSNLAEEFGKQGVQFIGIDSNYQDSVEEIQAFIRQHPLPFPVIQDPRQVLADQFGATRTPEVFLLDETSQIHYQGRIDDQFSPGVTRREAARDDLQVAIQEFLAGRPVSVARTEAVGCLIGRAPRPVDNKPTAKKPETNAAAPVNFSQQVSRVLRRNCVECHRAGEIAPFALLDYDEVVGWADTMLEVIDQGRMPPWHADPAVGQFANARHMPDEDKRILREWVEAGMPEGDPADLPESLVSAEGWQLPREPDLILPMHDRGYDVPAAGVVEYQYFVIDPQFTEDRWVRAAQVVPGKPGVVHHAIVFIRPPDGERMRGVGWLTAYVPGQRLVELPAGYARRIPKGSKLVFQMHYTTNGTAQRDQSHVGIVFTDRAEVTHEVMTLVGLEQEFEIPPHAASHEVRAEIGWLPKEGTILAFAPHMHYRGKSFQLFAEREGRDEPLLNVPRYDFNWQHSYELSQPLPLAGIDRLHFRATFDNSAGNPFNPDPTQRVHWGDQSWEEMAVAFVAVAQPLDKKSPAPSPPKKKDPQERQRKVDRFVDDFFAQLDADGDGAVQHAEAPLSVRRLSFQNFDENDDQQITRDEVRRVAERIL